MPFPITPDGRYFVVRERLWRCSNPDVPDDTRQRLVTELMKHEGRKVLPCGRRIWTRSENRPGEVRRGVTQRAGQMLEHAIEIGRDACSLELTSNKLERPINER
jgi:hypothetical protein